jgi:hypothetical protein
MSKQSTTRKATRRVIMFESAGWDVNAVDVTDFNKPKIVATLDDAGNVISGSLAPDELSRARRLVGNLRSL